MTPDNAPIVLHLPADMATDIVRAGMGKQLMPRKGAMDVVVVTIGVGGSLVSLTQAPTAISDFANWICTWVRDRQTTVLLQINRTTAGDYIIKVSQEIEPRVVQQALESARSIHNQKTPERRQLMSTPLLIGKRGAAMTVEPLQMRCTATETPEPLDGQPLSRWIGISEFTGESQVLEDGTTTGTRIVNAAGAIAMAVTEDRILAIVGTEPSSDPAVWINAPHAELTIKPIGTEGLLRKRPRLIELATPTWNLKIGSIGQLFGHHAKMNQSAALLKHLSNAG